MAALKPRRSKTPAPRVVIFAGPNGAGKSTHADAILEALEIPVFVNADYIARGLSRVPAATPTSSSCTRRWPTNGRCSTTRTGTRRSALRYTQVMNSWSRTQNDGIN